MLLRDYVLSWHSELATRLDLDKRPRRQTAKGRNRNSNNGVLIYDAARE
jgi:hypothetical protein